MRPSGRTPEQLRSISIEPGVSRYAEGSCLIRCGATRVLCTASVDNFVPSFLKNTGKGWVTAEYGMLPRATHTRGQREAAKGKQSGRTQEIQRLIGRSLRAVVDLQKLGERQIVIDCDVLEADGGTRTASITGGYVALHHAIAHLLRKGDLKASPLTAQVAAISAGICGDRPMVDLDYDEDSKASMDANFVLTSDGRIVELQCTAESHPIADAQFTTLMTLARSAMESLFHLQKEALS